MTIHTGCFSDCQSRQTELNQLANNCQLTPISILVKNEQKRVGELNELGIRQQWEQIIFCTWTFNADSGVRSSDLISKTLRFASQSINKTIGWFTGNEQIYREQFFQRLLLKSFEQGFIPWEILLNTKIGLETQPCTSEELWGWLWRQFNQTTPPPVPQLLLLEETATDYRLSEIKTSDIAMGKVHDPRLAQRVDSLLLRTLEAFLNDPDIIERYNLAFQAGWKSPQWQEMPTLTDLLRFCSKEQLNLQNYEAIDQAAINQIHSQIVALLASPLGDAVGKPLL